MLNLSHKISNNRKLLTQIQHFMQQYYQLYQRRSQSPTTLTDDPSLDLQGIYSGLQENWTFWQFMI